MTNVSGGRKPTMLEADSRYPLQGFLIAQKSRVAVDMSGHDADKTGLAIALRRKDAAEVIAVIENAMQRGGHLWNISKATWLEVTRLVAPSRGMPGIHRMHRSMNGRTLRQVGHRYGETREKVVRWLLTLLSFRTSYGHSPELSEYRILLEFAARIGSSRATRKIWKSMKKENVVPDLPCYNAFMESLLWDENARLPQASRSADTIPRRDYKSTNIMLFETGMLGEINTLFSEMASHGIPADTTTFCALMTALGRDGDVEAVNSMLHRVWGIDVETAMSDEDAPGLPPRYPPSSPLCPNSKMLITLINVYGSNNQVPLVLRLVDLISQQYHLPITSNIYYQMMQWTWLQARYKDSQASGKDRRVAKNITSLSTMSELMETMRADPSARAVSMEMYHLTVRGTLGPFRAQRSFEPLEDAKALYIHSVEKHRVAQLAFIRARQTSLGEVGRTRLLRLQHRTREAERTKRRNHTFLLRFARIVLSQYVPRAWVHDGVKYRQMDSWQTRGVPDFVDAWRNFVPSIVNYRIATGLVQLQVRSEAEIEKNKTRHRKIRRHTKLLWLNDLDKTEPAAPA